MVFFQMLKADVLKINGDAAVFFNAASDKMIFKKLQKSGFAAAAHPSDKVKFLKFIVKNIAFDSLYKFN